MKAEPVDNVLNRRSGPSQQVVRQAISWVLRLRNHAAHPALRQQCEVWRAAHHEHELAWQRVQSLHSELAANLRAVPGAHVALDTLENSAQRLGRRQALKLLSGVALIGSAAWLGKDLGWQPWNADFATATGEHRGFQLPDGTRLELNTDSAADLDYTTEHRLISLTRGEIMLTCGRDPERPLLVRSRHGLFEGLDGRFVVRQDNTCTRLSVTRGTVAIRSHRGGDGKALLVGAGQSYLISSSTATMTPPLDMDVGAWADGLLVTRNMRLEDFLNEVGRYRQGYLKCATSIADLRLSGVFRLEDTDKLLAVLPRTLPVQLRYRTRWWVTVQESA
ncbi:FecR domain-containing protein [Pseudomonas fluorescens]|uniref:FecR family protein n=1 Tax=Pseudomonas fluorescens TaxID=294 RepID=A0A944DQW7_PSEFL|nr:FecR family protein [Pseudomonas fluorescens]MBT2298377.1 FecR family protein [Pseudomonas fluorescens]MBT2310561.1 FecR family protein [Pseudomonas fluorescens]MBT2310927.1 FecR family protein [Pseudomonas fluorescens]MBT2320510.1 FecR family protein [Pseudomonas fluorescens]MBT2331099.1 FecR family protein [Pseudomonas fluorescens]